MHLLLLLCLCFSSVRVSCIVYSHGFSFLGDYPYASDIKEWSKSSFYCNLENSVLKTGVFRFACSPSKSDDAIQYKHVGELAGLARCSIVFIVLPVGFVEAAL